jgi:hypothetical protein
MMRTSPALFPALACVAALALGACADQAAGPVAPAVSIQPGATTFNARDFAWSTARGTGAIEGELAYHPGGVRYACRGRDVILTPETAWSRLRMEILYGSSTSATVPLTIVRARTPSASSGDYASYVRKTTCNEDDRFIFEGLPDGAWFVITLARPLDGAGEAMAVMRRVETHGAPRAVTLN